MITRLLIYVKKITDSRINKWLYRFLGGFLLWLFAIAFGLIALKGDMVSFGSAKWWHETGTVYLLWGALNYFIFFGIVHFIIPGGFLKKRYGLMLFYTYLLIIAIGVIKYYFVTMPRFHYVLVSYYKDEKGDIPVYFTFWQYLRKTIFTGTFVASLAYAFGLTRNWFKGEKLRKELELKQKDAELAFLRMQLNPHFLFNTLNSVYSLTLKKNDDAPVAVLKLSEMMRYMLYEKEDSDYKVSLQKEIAYLENYIALQQIRFKNNIHVNFFVDGDLENKKIVPLILISFIENAFKHGELENAAHPLTISLVVEGERLILNVKNRKTLDNIYYQGGIGLKNVKRRLILLYPARHQMNITENDEFYQSDLVLIL